MLIQLSDILLHDGKKETFTVDIGMDAIQSQLGEFKIVEKTPLTLSITNAGEKKLEI